MNPVRCGQCSRQVLKPDWKGYLLIWYSGLHPSHETKLPSFENVLKFAQISQDERLSSHCTTEDHTADDQQYSTNLDMNIGTVNAETYVPSITIDTEDRFQVHLWRYLHGQPLARWDEIYRNHDHERIFYSQYDCNKTAVNDAGTSKNSEHSAKEKQRRERHAILLAMMDTLCPSFIVKTTSNFLPFWKEELRHTAPTNQSHKAKGSGKDEVLAGTVFALLMANWHIEADRQLRVVQEDVIRQQQQMINDMKVERMMQLAPTQLPSPVASNPDVFIKKRKRN